MFPAAEVAGEVPGVVEALDEGFLESGSFGGGLGGDGCGRVCDILITHFGSGIEVELATRKLE